MAMVAAHIGYGQHGEKLAAQWYLRHGLQGREPQLALQSR